MTLLQAIFFPHSLHGKINFTKSSRWTISREPPVETLLDLSSSLVVWSSLTGDWEINTSSENNNSLVVSSAIILLSFYFFLERVGCSAVEPKLGWWLCVFDYLYLVINFFHIISWVLFGTGKHFPNCYMPWSMYVFLKSLKAVLWNGRDNSTKISLKHTENQPESSFRFFLALKYSLLNDTDISA